MRPYLISLAIEIIIGGPLSITMYVFKLMSVYDHVHSIWKITFSVQLAAIVIYFLLLCYIFICSYSVYQDLKESNRRQLPTNVYTPIGSADSNTQRAGYEINNETMPKH